MPQQILSPLWKQNDSAVIPNKNDYEVFGFAPYWTINKLDNVDFNILTTFAYFGIPVNADGSFDESNVGYKTFYSDKVTKIFDKAHDHGTRVVATLTQMDKDTILSFLDDEKAQDTAAGQAAILVKNRGIDGVNIDFEYISNPGAEYRRKFTNFVAKVSKKMHEEVPGSYVSVSVLASSAKDEKLYDIAGIAKNSDSIFMMAYDFATTGSDTVIPTSPLYGYKEGKYWYDVSTAVEDFLKLMPADKLVLGLPWYGYNYPVTEPGVKVAKYQGYSYYYWRNRRRYIASYNPPSNAQTYADAKDEIVPDASGWDEDGQVGWMAYKEDGIWRMIFLDDEQSLRIKYRFAKAKNLGGIGMWALGFDEGKSDMWSLLNNEFGTKIASTNIQ